ncbi:GAF domain-containing sensor histidine kinase [Mycolicibacterium aubagnense]|nr:GAF domain-containing sensor histidine kinase [Mycolicibacterium aubagnense]TLH69547.1 histidine kinase [Mycolicibacterium aubagnense]WGI35488.1 GAF domain-containing sensor histidine kinase [Mycolicibacterium aubagnense]
MHEQLDELLAGRDQMESLLRVIVGIGGDLDLDTTLHRIIDAAIELTGSRYGALGVRGPDGMLDAFLFKGIGAELQARIGHLPVGKGVLGVLLDRTEPLRVDDLTQHPAAVGFPEHHPPMRAFLGMPIVIRSEVYGSLYVTDDRAGYVFTESDENAIRALGSAAGVAIDNARLFERQRASARWMNAGREITSTLLSATSPEPPLQMIAERVRELADAEQVIVLIPNDIDRPGVSVDALAVVAAAGEHSAELPIGYRVPIDESTSGEVFRSGTAVITETFRHLIPTFSDLGERPTMAVPLRSADRVTGVLALVRSFDRPRFTSDDLSWVVAFANHAVVALTLAEASEQARELTILADRERIARDLHDHVIQRLFAAGMDLQGTVARVHSPEIIARLTRTIDELQSTITEIRTTIFHLQSASGGAIGFRERIQATAVELTEHCDLTTTVRIRGPLTVVSAELSDHAHAVVAEAISNAVRHSGASSLTVEVNVADELVINVLDDGRGIPADNHRRSGLENMSRRAQQLGGTCEFLTPASGGTHVCWTVPLELES